MFVLLTAVLIWRNRVVEWGNITTFFSRLGRNVGRGPELWPHGSYWCTLVLQTRWHDVSGPSWDLSGWENNTDPHVLLVIFRVSQGSDEHEVRHHSCSHWSSYCFYLVEYHSAEYILICHWAYEWVSSHPALGSLRINCGNRGYPRAFWFPGQTP